jgi:hypothetical protein
LDTVRFRALEPLFQRAPNAHNTQPWRLHDVPGAVEVRWDEADELAPSDPVHRDLRLSLGAFIESCLTVCAAQGVAARFVADYDPGDRRVGRFVGAHTPAPTTFTVAEIAARRTWRGRWMAEPPPDDVLESLAALAAAGGGRLVTLDCRLLHPLLSEASRWFVSDHGILGELRTWSRLTRRHPDYQRDGLTDVALALRRYETWGMRAALRRARPSARRQGRHRHGSRRYGLRWYGLRAALASGQAKAFRGDGRVLVLLVPSGTDETGEIEFGRLVHRLWLLLTRHGYAAHPQSHLIDCPTTLGPVRELAAAGGGEQPLWIARIGRPDPRRAQRIPPSARRVPLPDRYSTDEDHIHPNRVGSTPGSIDTGNPDDGGPSPNTAAASDDDGDQSDPPRSQRGRHRDRRSRRERRQAAQ